MTDKARREAATTNLELHFAPRKFPVFTIILLAEGAQTPGLGIPARNRSQPPYNSLMRRRFPACPTCHCCHFGFARKRLALRRHVCTKWAAHRLGGGPRAGAGDLQATDRDQYHGYAAGQRDHRDRGHAEAISRCGISGGGCASAGAGCAQTEPGRPACAPAARPTEKPVLFLCHMDVVEALRSDWPPIRLSLSRRMATTTGAARRT